MKQHQYSAEGMWCQQKQSMAQGRTDPQNGPYVSLCFAGVIKSLYQI